MMSPIGWSGWNLYMIRSTRTRLVVAFLAPIIISSGHLSAADEKSSTRLQFQYVDGPTRIPAARENEPRLKHISYEKAIAYLDDGAVAWQNEHGCITCHTNGSYLLSRPVLSDRFGPPKPQVRAFFEAELRKARTKPTHLPPEQSVYLAAGLATDDAYVRKKLSDTTVDALRYMFSRQNDRGTWDWPTCWPPLEDSSYHGATVAAMAVGTAERISPGIADDPAIKAGSDRLKMYLAETGPPYDYHRILLLWADCRWPGLLTPGQKLETIELIHRRQRDDGGWSLRTLGAWESRHTRLVAESDRDDPPSDGHATGLAITVLREAGVRADDPHIRRGIAWLKSNQRESGRWWTRSLNNDQFGFITYSGTCYPLLALHACGEIGEKTIADSRPSN